LILGREDRSETDKAFGAISRDRVVTMMNKKVDASIVGGLGIMRIHVISLLVTRRAKITKVEAEGDDVQELVLEDE